MLEPSHPSSIPTRVPSPPPPVVIDDDLEYEIAEVLDSKLDRRFKKCPLLYYVQWAGYEGTDEEFSWIPATDLSNSPDALAEFHARYPDKPGPWPLT